jgi:hypothetical protein
VSRLGGLVAFAAVVDAGSFVRSAKRLFRYPRCRGTLPISNCISAHAFSTASLT